MIAAMMLILAQAPTIEPYEPNPPKSAMRRIKEEELLRIVPNSQIIFGIPGQKERQFFFKDGRYEQYRQFPVERGSWSIKQDMICAAAPREICNELWQDRRGRYYYVSGWDGLKRPWRIEFTPNAKLPTR